MSDRNYIETVSMGWSEEMRNRYFSKPLGATPSIVQAPVRQTSAFESDQEKFVDAAAKGNLAKLLEFTSTMVIDSKNSNGETPLIAASIAGHSRAAFFLLSKGANVLIMDNTGDTAIHHATHGDHIDVVEKLATKCNINLRNKSGQTILHLAVKENKCRIMEFLMKANNVNFNEQDINGETPIHIAISTRNLKMFTKLLEKPIDFTVYNSEGKNPLNLAISIDEFEFVKAILQSNGGMDILPRKTMYGESNLQIAIRKQYSGIVSYLFSPSMHPEQMIENDIDKKYGFTALHWAVLQLNLNLMEKITKLNPHLLNIGDHSGKTPLDHVCFRHANDNTIKEKLLDVAIMLIASGADMTMIQNKDQLYKLIRDISIKIQNLRYGCTLDY